MFSLSALLLDDALKLMTPLTNSAINHTLDSLPPLPKQHNRQDLSSGCLEATCQAQSTLIMQLVIVVAGQSATSDISQGSVTTPMRCGEIFNVNVTTNFLLILSVKEFRQSVNV